MSGGKVSYICQSCGVSYGKWRGKCDCGQWNTLVLEENIVKPGKAPSQAPEIESLSSRQAQSFPRALTGIREFDRACGGGIVAGSVSLLAGDPGIGKSTLLLKVGTALAEKLPVLYVSGEESAHQVRLRAHRMGLQDSPMKLLSTNDLTVVLDAISSILNPDVQGLRGFIIIDSIQTMSCAEVGATAGTLAQIRQCIQHLVTLAKSTGLGVMVVGHVTKDGMIAGPKVLEHMVDTVLYFEGEKSYPYRLLRTMKNRFGSTHEVGVFDMTNEGLQEVLNPSSLFLSQGTTHVPGACIFAGMEGSRPLLIEIQALSLNSFLPSPRRAVVGWDSNRLSTVLAVLEARCQVQFSNKDVFLTVLGGMRITDPAADLCVALALLSCLKKRPVPRDAVAFGEIGLTGEVRPVTYSEFRLKEAKHLGFSQAFMAPSKQENLLKVIPVQRVQDLIGYVEQWPALNERSR